MRNFDLGTPTAVLAIGLMVMSCGDPRDASPPNTNGTAPASTGPSASDSSSDAPDSDSTASETTSASRGTATSDDTGTDDQTAGDDGAAPADPDHGTFVTGLRLVGLEVNQGVAVMVAAAGQTTTPDRRNARLVRNRPALVRAIYELEAGWSSAEVEARLTLYQSDGTYAIKIDRRRVDAAPDLTRRGGTFEWRVESEQMKPGARYSIGLFVPGAPNVPAPSAFPRIPTQGSDELGVPDQLMRLEVVLVPVRTRNGQTNATDENLEHLRQALYEYNPVEEIEVRIREAPIDADSVDSCLDEASRARSADRPGPHVYYLGIVPGQPEGVSWVADDSMRSASQRVSCSAARSSWEGAAAMVAAHEIGHAQGSEHTPGCGADYTVRDFPYVDGQGRAEVGVYGYGVLSDTLYPPKHYDIMSYCTPWWVSDYTYENWRRRVTVLSSWSQSLAEDEDAVRPEILWGVDRGHEVAWWIAPDILPELPVANRAHARTVSIEGVREDVPVYVARRSDPSQRSVLIPLPGSAEDLAAIEVTAFDSTFRFDDPPALRAAYDRLVAAAP